MATETHSTNVLCSACRKGYVFDYEKITVLIEVRDFVGLRAWCPSCGISYDIEWLKRRSKVLGQVLHFEKR
jgi:hypothetical protein